MRKVLTRFHFTGDARVGMALTGFGKKQLRKLESNMRFTKAKVGKDKPVKINGAIVHTSSIFGVTNVYIDVPTSRENEINKYVDCQCYPCFTFGIIKSVTDVGVYPAVHTAMLCALPGKTRAVYFEYENIISPGWERYNVGQYVFVGSKCNESCASGTESILTLCLTKRLAEEGTLGHETDDELLYDVFIVPIFNKITMLRQSEILVNE